MAYFRACAAISVLLLVASCAYDHATGAYGMSQGSASTSVYAPDRPAPMDESRRIAKEDCTRPVTVDRGNLLCR